MKFQVTDEGLQTDLAYGTLQISGDEAKGFRPFQLMISSIVGCSGSVYRNILQKQRMEIHSLEIIADVERNVDEANRLETIKLTYIVDGEQLDLTRLQNALKIAQKNCAMVRSVEDSILIEETVKIK